MLVILRLIAVLSLMSLIVPRVLVQASSVRIMPVRTVVAISEVLSILKVLWSETFRVVQGV